MSTFHLEVLVIDRAFYSDDVEELVVKTPGGEIGILKGHTPLVVTVSVGPLKIKKDGEWSCAFISEGFMEVTAEKAVVLADSAEWPDEIDTERAKAAEEKVRELLGGGPDGREAENSRAALQRALWRQKISGKKTR